MEFRVQVWCFRVLGLGVNISELPEIGDPNMAP